MTKKSLFVTKCSESLSKYFTQEGTKATMDVMTRIKLNNLNDNEEVPKDLTEKCKETIYQRIKMLKGEELAEKFKTDMVNL